MISRIYQIADVCGNTVQCTHIIEVDDSEAPTIVCPDGLVASCNISEHAPFPDYAAFNAVGGSADIIVN